jgi:ketosteroid isomerase-like protein
MSQENAEVVRRLYAGWEKGDFATETDAYDPKVELVVDVGFEQTTATGFDEMRRVWREHLTLWESWSPGPIERLVEAGDHVVVASALRARSKRGHSIASQDAGAAFTFRAGRIVRIVATDRLAKAFEAVGLSE